MRDKIFISYSHRDNRFRQRLETHLKSMTSNASFWSDMQLEAGDDWEAEIHSAMDEAAVAILLVSADFLASDFIRDVELPQLYKAEKEDGITIIPVMLYQCNCGDLMKYQYINTPDKPLGGLTKAKQEEVFARLSKVAMIKLAVYAELTRYAEYSNELSPFERQEDSSEKSTPTILHSAGVSSCMIFPVFPFVIIAIIGAIIGGVIGGFVKKSILGVLIGASIGAVGIFILIALIIVVVLLIIYLLERSTFYIKSKRKHIPKSYSDNSDIREWDYEPVIKPIQPSETNLADYFADLFDESNFNNTPKNDMEGKA